MRTTTWADEVVAGLFGDAPLTESALLDRLEGRDPAAVRQALVAAMVEGRVPTHGVGVWVAALAHLGTVDVTGPLLEVALDGQRQARLRAACVAAMEFSDSDGMQEAAERLGGAALVSLTEATFLGLLVDLEGDPARAEGLADLLGGFPQPIDPRVAHPLESARRGLGIPAALAYAGAIRRPALAPLLPALLEAIAAEGGPLGLEVVERARDEAEGGRRRALQEALIRMHTRAIDPDAHVGLPAAQAWVGSCDGHGVYPLLVAAERPSGGLCLTDLTLVASGGVVGAVVIPEISHADLHRSLEHIREEAHVELVELPVAVAAELADEAAAQGEARALDPPADAASALALVRQYRATPPHAPPAAEPQRSVRRAVVDHLLESREAFRDWFFDDRELRDVPYLPSDAPVETGWKRSATRHLDTPRNRTRLAAMARHMGRVAALAGRARESSRWGRLAEQAAGGLHRSALFEAMLDRSYVVQRAPGRPQAGEARR